MNNSEMISKLIGVGGKEWKKGNMHRVYFDDLARLFSDASDEEFLSWFCIWFLPQYRRSSVYFNVQSGEWGRGASWSNMGDRDLTKIVGQILDLSGLL